MNKGVEIRRMWGTRLFTGLFSIGMRERGPAVRGGPGRKGLHCFVCILWACIRRFVHSSDPAIKQTDSTTDLRAMQTYEPMLKHLLERSRYGAYQIDEIWSIDLAQHGDSGLINAPHMGGICTSFSRFTFTR